MMMINNKIMYIIIFKIFNNIIHEHSYRQSINQLYFFTLHVERINFIAIKYKNVNFINYFKSNYIFNIFFALNIFVFSSCSYTFLFLLYNMFKTKEERIKYISDI